MSNGFADLLNFASLIIGIQNLSENREQSAHNDIQSANQNQAEFMLKNIHEEFLKMQRLFEEQNDTLRKIIVALEKIKSKESTTDED